MAGDYNDGWQNHRRADEQTPKRGWLLWLIIIAMLALAALAIYQSANPIDRSEGGSR